MKPKLTPRQRQIVRLIKRGMTQRQIARRLDISERTVWHHTAKIREATGARTTLQAIFGEPGDEPALILADIRDARGRLVLSSQERFEVLKRDRFTCQYCGRKAPDVELEVDHVIPRSAGGTNVRSNLITACTDCNNGKGDRALGPVGPPSQTVEINN